MKDNYNDLYNNFRWSVPKHFNIAEVCSARWAQSKAHAQRVAVFAEDETGARSTLTYGELQTQANQLSCALRELGVKRGDRVAIVLPQRIETAVLHIAVYQMGAVAMPLSILFGPEALEYRLQDSGAVLVVCDSASVANVLAARSACPAITHVMGVQALGVDSQFKSWLVSAPYQFTAIKTLASEAAVLIYTSGTTGPPKGALIPHRALIGNLSGFTASQNWIGSGAGDHQPQPGDIFWSPADWAWTGGLMDALLPTLYFGLPIVGYNGRFSPDVAFSLLERYGVTNTFLFPTALKAMMKAHPAPQLHFTLKLRAIMSAGEAVGDAVFEYCQNALGVTVNEMFGQTELNYIVGNCALQWPARPGSMGRPYPGHRVAVIDNVGCELPPGEAGDVALHRCDRHGQPDPVFFIGYWNASAATGKKYSGDWCRTGDVAVMDADGYLWYQGRSDDVFKVSGYRVGPSEIENCLVKHPAVANTAVVPKPDADKGNVVKAFIVLQPGHAPGAATIKSIQAHVRSQLAPYEYPKEIVFVDALPMTTTGKVQRRLLK